MTALYDHIGTRYSLGRRTDPEIAERIHAHLMTADSILNIGAGTGSYEPQGANLIAVEPSLTMIQQRPSNAHLAKQATAEALPFEDNAFSHGMTVLSMHHWSDRQAAFDEIKRVVRKRFVALTWNPDSKPYWLSERYFPEIHQIDQSIFPTLAELEEAFPGIKFITLPIPANCKDGFTASFWARPEAYLNPEVRASMSTFSKINALESGLQKLEVELNNGFWQTQYGDLRHRSHLDTGYIIAVWDQ
ncbi:class I SAM-dependent methyltransferase [Pseudoteredinibacter isoporae]|uniref:class I SAM-dependent methyltransferase n=1 Tax=Pseudoteredinibacter isoporae TaxID=570281 RepID=UPI0031091FA0